VSKIHPKHEPPIHLLKNEPPCTFVVHSFQGVPYLEDYNTCSKVGTTEEAGSSMKVLRACFHLSLCATVLKHHAAEGNLDLYVYQPIVSFSGLIATGRCDAGCSGDVSNTDDNSCFGLFAVHVEGECLVDAQGGSYQMEMVNERILCKKEFSDRACMSLLNGCSASHRIDTCDVDSSGKWTRLEGFCTRSSDGPTGEFIMPLHRIYYYKAQEDDEDDGESSLESCEAGDRSKSEAAFVFLDKHLCFPTPVAVGGDYVHGSAISYCDDAGVTKLQYFADQECSQTVTEVELPPRCVRVVEATKYSGAASAAGNNGVYVLSECKRQPSSGTQFYCKDIAKATNLATRSPNKDTRGNVDGLSSSTTSPDTRKADGLLWLLLLLFLPLASLGYYCVRSHKTFSNRSSTSISSRRGH